MSHRIFHQQLDDERRQHRIAYAGLQIPLDAQPIDEADRLDVEIAAHERELVAKTHHVRRVTGDRLAQQLTQLGHDANRRRIVAPTHQRAYRVKGVEQEVRVKACPQCRQLGARELLAQLRIADLSFLETPRLVQRHAAYSTTIASALCGSPAKAHEHRVATTLAHADPTAVLETQIELSALTTRELAHAVDVRDRAAVHAHEPR